MSTAVLPPPAPNRPRTLMVASVLATSAAVVGFCSLIAIYVARRSAALASGESWYPEGSIELGPPGMMMATMVLSAFTAQWAVQAARDEDRPHGFVALGLQLLFGAAVLNQFWFVYTDVGFGIDDGEAQLLFYVVTGSFIVMLIAAMAFFAVTSLKALFGQFNRANLDAVSAAAVFWHAVVFMYSVIWYAIFITK